MTNIEQHGRNYVRASGGKPTKTVTMITKKRVCGVRIHFITDGSDVPSGACLSTTDTVTQRKRNQ